MDLYKEILAKVLEQEEMTVTFPNLSLNAAEIIEMECYKTLRRIKDVIEDDSLEDERCFSRIEEIICAFEDVGSDGGIRHDFG